MSGVNWTEQQLQDYYAGRGRRVPFTDKIPPKKSRAHGSHTAGVMNKTEQSYADYLKTFLNMGIDGFKFEAVTLRIAPDCRFTPDFIVFMPYGNVPEIHEIKSTRKGKMFSEDDSKVKIKVAAEMFPCFRFFWVFKNKYGEWEKVEVG